MNENDEETKENDEETSALPNGDYVYEEKLKIDMLVDKTNEPVHVRNQAIIALSRLFEGDMSRRIVPFYSRHQESHQTLKTTDSLPYTQEDLNVYLTNPVLHINPKTKSQLRLTFFVRTQSKKHTLKETKQANGNFEWLKSKNIYIELMELESTDNERIGMIIGKAPRITSLPDFRASLRMQISNNNSDQTFPTETPPFQLNIDNIGTATDKTRTRVITVTCSKVHAKLLTTIFQKNFPSDTNQPFLSYSVLYSLDTVVRHSILQQHQQRTYGRSMLDVTIPDFNLLSTLVMVKNKSTSLRAAIGNLRNLDGSLLHIDIDEATKNGDTIMIVAPQDMESAKKVVGEWILHHHNQCIDWSTSSNFQSATHRLDFSSRTSAAGFATAFPPMIITTTPTTTPRTTPRNKPTPAKTATNTSSPPNAWKSLSYSTADANPSTTRDTATTKTAASSSASQQTSLDEATENELYILRDQNITLNYRQYLAEARTTLIATRSAHHEIESIATVDDLSARIARLELAGDHQNKINQKLVLTLSMATEEDKKEALNDLGQRIDTKLRMRKTEKKNRAQEYAEVQAKKEQIPELTRLEERANLHVRRLKARLEKHANVIRDDEDESSDSSISTLGLSEFDVDDFDLSDSDEDDPMDSSMETSQLPSIPTAHPPTNQTPEGYDTNSDIIMDLVSIFESPASTNAQTTTASTMNDTTSSLQQAAATISALSLEDKLSSPTSEWETPPPEFFQEWKETAPKPKAQNSNATPRGPPGRLSPPTVNPTVPSNNRYAILEDLPLTRPPEDKHHQKAISPCPSKDQTSAPKTAPTNTPPRKSNLASRHSSLGIPTTSQPHATLQDAAPQVNSSIASFFATKHAKKGSPRKKKARTLTSSPPREDMSTGGTQEVEWSSPTGTPITSPPRFNLTNSHRHLLIPSEDFDEYDTDHQEPSQDTHNNNSDQQRSQNFSDDHSEDSSNHMLQRSPSQDNAQTYHDAQGNEFNTATLYTTDQDEVSETPTILASDDDEMGFNDHDQTHPEDQSLQSSYSPPSTSIQYNSPNAGLEGNND